MAAARGMARLARPAIVRKRGTDVLHDPWFNKGTAFPATERDRLGLRGLLPPRVMSFEQQIKRFMDSYRVLERNTRDGPKEDGSLAKWRILNRLHDRNETLYYKVLIDNIKEMAPIIYTPTVGTVCQNYSGLFRRPRGMYFSAEDKGEMLAMAHNWPADQALPPGILGLGDLGVQGIGIPIGKLDVYVAAAGINPNRVLPVQIDVGTNNAQLLANPLYKVLEDFLHLHVSPVTRSASSCSDMGLRQPRLEGDDYIDIIDEFMEAMYTRWPRVIVQFEDFQNKWAYRLLQRYRNEYRMFNDDVQGTACVAVAGLMSANRAQGRTIADLAHQKIVAVGAGSAGLGVINMTRRSMAMLLGDGPEAQAKSAANFWVVDAQGLVTQARKNLPEDLVEYARPLEESSGVAGLQEGATIADVVRKVKPDALLGLSGVGRIFTQEVLEGMRHDGNPRPAIFAMSNPTSNAECTSEEAFRHAGPHVIFASGSPFDDVPLEGGEVGHANQGNNMYLFPGIGLGALLSGARTISDEMLHAAAERLAAFMSEEDLRQGIIFPPLVRIREITREVATAVVRKAVEEDLAEGYRETNLKILSRMTEAWFLQLNEIQHA
eukprot:SM000148S01055  [mRNA]  locus=s148:278033:282819:- [translate_table: standard]